MAMNLYDYGKPLPHNDCFVCPECGKMLYTGNPGIGYDPTEHVSTYICWKEAPGASRHWLDGNWHRHKCECGYVVMAEGFGSMIRLPFIHPEE